MGDSSLKFAKILKDIRESREISIRLFSSICGFSPAYISDLEKSNRKPTLNVINSIIEKFRAKRLSQDKENTFLKKKIPKEIKNILIKEVEDANIKINNSYSSRKSISKPQNNKQYQSICLQKLRRYSYVAKNNPLLEINKEGKLPSILRDGEFIKELMNNGFSKINTCKKPSYI